MKVEQAAAVLKAASDGWALAIASGAALLYASGYLAVRFHLTALGVATDLSIVDERYLFAGAKFLIFSLTLIPTILLIAAVVGLPFIVFRRVIKKKRWGQINITSRGVLAITAAGILIFVQFVLRHCFLITDVLLQVPVDDWIMTVFFLPGGPEIYYTIALTVTILTVAVAIRIQKRHGNEDRVERALRVTILFLIGVEVFLLPITYGVMVMDKHFPRAAAPVAAVESGEEAWLVWEGPNDRTYFIRNSIGANRRLVTISIKKQDKLEVSGYDSISTLSATHVDSPGIAHR